MSDSFIIACQHSHEQSQSTSKPGLSLFTFIVDGPGLHKHQISHRRSRSSCPSLSPSRSLSYPLVKIEPSSDNKFNDQSVSESKVPCADSNCIQESDKRSTDQLDQVSLWQPMDPNDKPPYSYATLIAHAILSSKNKRLTLSEIYQWITEHYPYYTSGEHGWQNSIRHNLSLNKAFIKLDRISSKVAMSGKGSYWTLRAGSEQLFIDNLAKRRGPIRKPSVALDRSVSHRRSRRYPESDKDTTHRTTNSSPLFTTFRMSPVDVTRNRKTRQSQLPWKFSHEEDMTDSDCDSGVDTQNDLLSLYATSTQQIKDSQQAMGTPWMKPSQEHPWSDDPISVSPHSHVSKFSESYAQLNPTQWQGGLSQYPTYSPAPLSASASAPLPAWSTVGQTTSTFTYVTASNSDLSEAHLTWVSSRHLLDHGFLFDWSTQGPSAAPCGLSFGNSSYNDEPCMLGLGTATASLVGSLDWYF